jgi:hypothetical protein
MTPSNQVGQRKTKQTLLVKSDIIIPNLTVNILHDVTVLGFVQLYFEPKLLVSSVLYVMS